MKSIRKGAWAISPEWEGNEEVRMQIFIGEPMSNAKAQSSNEIPRLK
jgi:hypothetical protein